MWYYGRGEDKEGLPCSGMRVEGQADCLPRQCLHDAQEQAGDRRHDAVLSMLPRMRREERAQAQHHGGGALPLCKEEVKNLNIATTDVVIAAKEKSAIPVPSHIERLLLALFSSRIFMA